MPKESTPARPAGGGAWISEDWLALLLGLLVFGLSLGSFKGSDLLGWAAKAGVWIDPGKAVTPVSAQYQGLSPLLSVALTYLFSLAIMTLGAVALRANVPKFAIGFSLAFWLSYVSWLMGHFAYIAATKEQTVKFGIPWALSMSGEFGFIVALVLGLVIGNFFPGVVDLMKEAARPELYIKTGIVILGAGLGIKAAESFGLATNIMFLGFCAIVVAYLIYWAVVYYIARRYFRFSREWSAPLASGISICGVSAAIATGAAIRARPIVPIMVSSLVVIFVAVEMVILPFLAKFFLWTEPLVAGAWMGLAVKSDGGAIASGAITDALIRAQALDAAGIKYAEGWVTMTATTVKMFIDVFIGVWAFLLAYIWVAKIDVKPGQKVDVGELWRRFPKFVIGYVATFAILLTICWPAAKALGPADNELAELKASVTSLETRMRSATDPAVLAGLERDLAAARARQERVGRQAEEPRRFLGKAKASSSQGDVFRGLFFLLCFFTIGLVSNFKKLMAEGLGRLAAVYCISLFGFIIWVGLFISWLFFHGVKPPTL